MKTVKTIKEIMDVHIRATELIYQTLEGCTGSDVKVLKTLVSSRLNALKSLKKVLEENGHYKNPTP